MRDDRIMAPIRMSELLRVGPGPVDLNTIDPRSTPGLPHEADRSRDRKLWARSELVRVGRELFAEQDKLFAAAKAGGSAQRLLLVLQAMDCGGKDGTINKVVGQFNPQGVHIVSFGKPTEEELAHDFLWRIERSLPAAGLIGVFNRSHYEDVLVVRVHELVPRRTWQARYDRINEFERQLTESGCVIVKVMLHISAGEQRRRLLDRLTDPAKVWKYNPSDVDERARWADYQQAYEDTLAKCGTAAAPWHVVPADRKWYRDWAVANLLLETLREMRLAYPAPDFDPDAEKARLLAGDEGEHRMNSA
jgi:PPK2 family polyphosphate:nucleotide phosphotransferase